MKIQIVLLLLFYLNVSVFSQEEIRPWEKLGISQTEWLMIQDNEMPMGKVEQLLMNGIGISEYFDHPWISLGLSESKWIAKRRSGLSNEDIERGIRKPIKDDSWKEGNKEIVRNDLKAISGNGQRVSALFLPGFQQNKNNQHFRGNIMIGLCGGAIVWSGVQTVQRKHFQGMPVFGIIVPTMVWSFIDFTMSSKRKNDSD